MLKRSYLDVKCSDLSGRKFLIEMQVEPVKEFAKRVVYNASKAYVGQLSKGESYLALTQVVAISICDFVMFPEFEHYLSEHMAPVTTGLGGRRRVAFEGSRFGRVSGRGPKHDRARWPTATPTTEAREYTVTSK